MGLVALRATGGVKSTAANTWDQKQTFAGEIEVDGALNHDGTTVGFYGVAPVTRPTAITQTYSAASNTHSNVTATQPATTGATNVTPFGYTTSTQANAIVTAVNATIDDVVNIKQVLNSVIDKLQSQGLLQ